MTLFLGLVLIAACLGVAVARPFGLSEGFVAVPAALLGLAFGVCSLRQARSSLHELAPTVLFLAAILTFGQLCAAAGVFEFLGGVAARLSLGSGRRLLACVVTLAALVTATLTLDATVILVTPVVVATTAALGIPSRPHTYACAHLANSGSLLLPVSNLTNLLAFSASGLSFTRFSAAMALPWLVACGLNWACLRTVFRADLFVSAHPPTQPRPEPRYALTVLILTVSGFALTTAVGIAPAWAALAGCVALGAPALVRRQLKPMDLLRAASVGFCVFVLALGILVHGVLALGVNDWLTRLLPSGTGLAALLGLAFLAAALSNLVNNLPSTLALIPLVAGSPLAVLVVLLGVNLGPNATYPGSLATLLWRRTLPAAERPSARTFHAVGLSLTPALLVASTFVLWLIAPILDLR